MQRKHTYQEHRGLSVAIAKYEVRLAVISSYYAPPVPDILCC